MDDAKLGARIAEVRKERGLTQVILAQKAQISKNYLSAVERGLHAPSTALLQAISDALAVTPGYLLDTDTSRQEPYYIGQYTREETETIIRALAMYALDCYSMGDLETSEKASKLGKQVREEVRWQRQ